MDNQSKQTWPRGWQYIILQNAILIGMPLIPFLYYTNDFSVSPTLHIAKFSAFSNGFMIYNLSFRLYKETSSPEIVAQLRFCFLIARLIIFNVLFLLVMKKKRFVYGSIFLNVALGFWGWVAGFFVYVING